jgi:predicted DsbA family dithiol-disulfide isomerase
MRNLRSRKPHGQRPDQYLQRPCSICCSLHALSSQFKASSLGHRSRGQQGKYWEMQSQLFFRREWAEQETPQDFFFEKVAKDLGLDLSKFKADLKDPAILANILADYQAGPTLGVQGTPTFFINGVIQPSFDYESLKKAIDDELAANP